MKTRILPGINIQYPISQLIVNGSKIIETRTYPLPTKYLGKDLFLFETPGPDGHFRARVIAIIRFSNSFKYASKKKFYEDSKRHLVNEDSPWSWKEKPKWGWKVESVSPLKKPVEIAQRRGIVFTSSISI
jgi:hypothetical protein